MLHNLPILKPKRDALRSNITRFLTPMNEATEGRFRTFSQPLARNNLRCLYPRFTE